MTMAIADTRPDTSALKAVAHFRSPIGFTATLNLGAAFMIYFTITIAIALCIDGDFPTDSRILFLVILYPVAGLGIAKIFTIQHDCGHGSYFADQSTNRLLGRLCSIVTFVPFTAWKEEHREHHMSFGNLDRQTFGDVRLLTVEEFKNASMGRRFHYRVFRNPAFLLLVAPLAYALLRQRVPSAVTAARIWSCVLHSIVVCAIYGTLLYYNGSSMLFVGVPSLYIAGVIAIIVFVVEHQFEDTHWDHSENWNFLNAAVASSSYLALPPVLEWFTGSIGYHHIHHLNPAIPSYRLKECFTSLGDRLPNKKITLGSIPKNLRFALWSHEKKKLVTFREAQLLKS